MGARINAKRADLKLFRTGQNAVLSEVIIVLLSKGRFTFSRVLMITLTSLSGQLDKNGRERGGGGRGAGKANQSLLCPLSHSYPSWIRRCIRPCWGRGGEEI